MRPRNGLETTENKNILILPGIEHRFVLPSMWQHNRTSQSNSPAIRPSFFNRSFLRTSSLTIRNSPTQSLQLDVDIGNRTGRVTIRPARKLLAVLERTPHRFQ